MSTARYADSYARTIQHLFDEIMASRQSADRVLASYFRLNKKHGGRDRKIIRETLFALFRWYGWLQQLPADTPQQLWFRQLVLSAELEQHAWQEIVARWREQADLASPVVTPSAALTSIATQLQQAFNQAFAVTELLPQWCWPLLAPLTEPQRQALCATMSQRPPIWARVQRMPRAQALAQLQQQGIAATAAPCFSDAISLGHKSLNLNELDLYQQGHLEIQDLASQVIGQICAPQPGQHWWDACSGAGGKSLQLAALMGDNGRIVASDIRPQALEELQKRARRSQVHSIQLAPWRGQQLPVTTQFDGVLVDAPCSCTGTWRRNPDMRWLDDSSAVTSKPALQRDILQRAAAAVKSGGVLVYATCSLAELENRAVVDSFLNENKQFSLETVVHPFTAARTEYLTVWPNEADTDGMFVVRMRAN